MVQLKRKLYILATCDVITLETSFFFSGNKLKDHQVDELLSDVGEQSGFVNTAG